MSEYVLMTDSSCDLPVKMVKELNVEVVQLEVLMEGYESRPNDKVDLKQFYEELRNKKVAKTSAVNVDQFTKLMEPHLKKGKDVLYLGFSSGLSGTYSSAYIAAGELQSKYPQRKIYTVDTLAASLGQGMLVYSAANLKNSGASIEQVRDFVEQNKLRAAHWFSVDDLMFLKRGGRVSPTIAVVGTVLGVKPVLHVDNEGKLISVSKARGRQKSLLALVEKMKETVEKPEEQVIFISHGDCREEAEFVASEIRKAMTVKNIVIAEIGPVIGAHAGPGTMALFFYGSQR